MHQQKRVTADFKIELTGSELIDALRKGGLKLPDNIETIEIQNSDRYAIRDYMYIGKSKSYRVKTEETISEESL